MEFLAKLMEMVGEGLDNIGPQVGAEISRQATQGAAELGSAFLGESNAYVPYGSSAYRNSNVHELEGLHNSKEGIEQEMGGHSM